MTIAIVISIAVSLASAALVVYYSVRVQILEQQYDQIEGWLLVYRSILGDYDHRLRILESVFCPNTQKQPECKS